MHPSREKPHLLVVDDDERLRTLLSQYLRQRHFIVSAVDSTHAAQETIKFFHIHLLILDVMMPEETGFCFLERLKKSDIEHPPILLLTAMGKADHRVKGLKLGAVDYLVKPFDLRELELRINLNIKKPTAEPKLVRFGTRILDLETFVLRTETTTFTLTPAEQLLFKVLWAHKNQPLAREALVEEMGESMHLRTIDVHINRLRQKLEPTPKNPHYLQTLRGQGYMLKVE